VTKLVGETAAAESGQELLLLNIFSDVNNEATKRSLFLNLPTRSKDGEDSGDTAFCYCAPSQTKTVIFI